MNEPDVQWGQKAIQVPAEPRSEMRILCICLEPTLSAWTTKHFGYSTRSCCTEQDLCTFHF